MYLDNPFIVDELASANSAEWLERYPDKQVRNVSIVWAQSADGEETPSRATRFAGIPTEHGNAYIDLSSGQEIALTGLAHCI